MQKMLTKGVLLSIVFWNLMFFSGCSIFPTGGHLANKVVNQGYNWNLADIYATKADWQHELTLIQKNYLPRIALFKGKLSKKPSLVAYLQLQEQLSRKLEKVYVYPRLLADENQTNSEATEMVSKAENLLAQAAQASAFVLPELLAMQSKKLQSYAKDPQLREYGHYFQNILKDKEHTLSTKEERLLALALQIGGASKDIYDKLTLADMVFPKIQDPQGREIQLSAAKYSMLLENKDRDFRNRAFRGIMGAYIKNKNTLAATLSAQVKQDIFYATARKYPTALAASLAGENIPPQVYNQLLFTVNKNLPQLHHYVDLRRQMLAVERVYVSDMFVPLVADYHQEITYPQAQQLLLKGLSPLGKDYLGSLVEGFDQNWVDAYEKPNKYSGAYCWGAYDTHPYVLLNYNNNLDAMLTLAHEMGHALNSYYSNKYQKYINASTPTFTAEVASTTNELLMLKYLLNHAQNDQEKLFILNRLVENIRGTVFNQVMYAEFEANIHQQVEQGDALSAPTLDKMWQTLLQKYYGPAFQSDAYANMGWARIPHFYMNFYVYKYATSLAAANQIVKDIETQRPQALSKYLAFIQAGSSDDPIKLLQNAGVDMTDTKALDNVLADFSSYVAQMESILKKQGKLKYSFPNK